MRYKTIARLSGATAMASIMACAGLGAPAFALDATGQLQVSVAQVGSGDTLLVDVNPDRTSGYWSFQVQELGKDGAWWDQCATWATEGSTETRALPLGAGTYRVVVLDKDGWTGTTSARVTLTGARGPGMPTGLTPTSPTGGGTPATATGGTPATATGGSTPPVVRPATVVVRAAAARHRSRFVVDVDPNIGKKSWHFRVQVKRANGTWSSLKKTYRTKGNAETRSVNLKAGIYRAVVLGEHGYAGSSTPGVMLVK